MKKALISFVSIVILLGMFGIASAYTIDNPGLNIETGTWSEMYTTSPSFSSSFLAQSNSSPAPISWSFNGMTYSGGIDWPLTFDANDEAYYTSNYTGGTFISSLFTVAISTAAVDALIYIDSGEYFYEGTITLSGPGGFLMIGGLDGTPINGNPLLGYSGIISIQRLDTPELPISAPEPITLLLLGFGLAGLAGIRRKFKG